MKIKLTFLAFLFCLPIPTRADIGPATFNGYTFTPYSEPQVRMASETVDIFIGDRLTEDRHIRQVCVRARFVMENVGPDSVVIDVGFPAQAEAMITDNPRKSLEERLAGPLKEHKEEHIYDFFVSINGNAFFQPILTIVDGAFNSFIPTDELWYGWNMSFPPGKTIVDVEYHVKTNYAYASVDQQIHYVLGTGRFWKDDIGEAVVRVHLSAEYKEDWVSFVWPRKHDRDDKTLIWRWTDYEPEFYDGVSVVFLPPEVLSEIRSLEQIEREDPNNVDVLFKLAKQYFYAACRKGLPRRGHPDFAKLAEIRLDRALEIDPTNCEVFRYYLTNYHRIRWDAFGLPDCRCNGLRKKQRSVIERAYKNCPDDQEIRLWHMMALEEPWEPIEEVGYETHYRNDKPWKVSLHDFKQNRGTRLRKYELDIMDTYYERTESISGVPFFKLKSKDLSERDKRRILSVLEKRCFYRSEYADSLIQFYRYH